MSPPRIVVATGALALCLPVLAAAQGLGDIAAKEREKRTKQTAEKKGPKTRLITDEDLSKGRPAATSAEGGTAAGGATAAPSGESAPAGSPLPEPEPPPDPLAAVRPQIDNLRQAQAQLSEIEARVRELSDKLNPMSGTFIYGGTGAITGDKVSEEAQVRQQLQEAEAQLRDARAAVASASQAVDDARPGRGGGPPPQ